MGREAFWPVTKSLGGLLPAHGGASPEDKRGGAVGLGARREAAREEEWSAENLTVGLAMAGEATERPNGERVR